MKQPNQAEISKFEDLPKNIEAGINRPNEFEVSLDGYEGPIDALLTLAQKQKVVQPLEEEVLWLLLLVEGVLLRRIPH